jgi:hypothetical protein
MPCGVREYAEEQKENTYYNYSYVHCLINHIHK